MSAPVEFESEDDNDLDQSDVDEGYCLFNSDAKLPSPDPIPGCSSAPDIDDEEDDIEDIVPAEPASSSVILVTINTDNYIMRGPSPVPDQTSLISISEFNNDSKPPMSDIERYNALMLLGAATAIMIPFEFVRSASSCARTLSYHKYLCVCEMSCCCKCGTFCFPDCRICFHKMCIRFAMNFVCHLNHDTFELLPDKDMPVSEWTAFHVVEWMAALNLYPYADIFRCKDIKGSDLLVLDRDKLLNMGIKDEFHQKAILSSVSELLKPSDNSMALEQYKFRDQHSHSLMQHTFSTLERCTKCHKFLRGLLHQGFVCLKCGLVAHRTCAATGLPLCAPYPYNPKILQHKILFGKGLCIQFDPPGEPAPPILVRCTEELEARARNDPSLELYNMYCGSPPAELVLELSEKLNDSINADVSEYSPACIASVLKKYLRELPDSLIPVQWYDKFVDATKAYLEDLKCAPNLNGLIQDLPIHHSSTLSFLMAHICRICQLEYSRGNRSPPAVVIQTLCHIILRPPWERIIQVVYNTHHHNRIVELLLLYCDWKEILPAFSAPPAVPPRKVSRLGTMGGFDNRFTISTKLSDAEWYWGDITREDVNEKLNSTPDGTFLVRDASSKCGEYTLTLRKGGANKLIKICHQNGKYGFTEPYTFNSVVELINFYRADSLSLYNASLDIRLKYPISKLNQDEDSAYTESIDRLIACLLDVHGNLLDKNKMFEQLTDDFNRTVQELTSKRLALDALKELVKVFRVHTKRQDRYLAEAQPHEIKSILENSEILKRRLKIMEDSCAQLDENLQQREAYNRSLERELTSLKPGIRDLMRECDKYQRWLLTRGLKQSRIRQLLHKEGDGTMGDDEADDLDLEALPHNEESTWLLSNCSRTHAEELLSGKPDGTFLIRPSSTSQHALSIACNGITNHCIIQNTNRGLGFAEPYNIYDSLKALVLHYSQNSLEIHNDSLHTALRFPIYAGDNLTNGLDGTDVEHTDTATNTTTTTDDMPTTDIITTNTTTAADNITTDTTNTDTTNPDTTTTDSIATDDTIIDTTTIDTTGPDATIDTASTDSTIADITTADTMFTTDTTTEITTTSISTLKD